MFRLKQIVRILKSALLFLSIPYISVAQDYQRILNYKIDYSILSGKQGAFVGLRSFENDRHEQLLLLVNPQTLKTNVDFASNYKISNFSFKRILKKLQSSTYVKDLSKASFNETQLQDAGIDVTKTFKNGINLTIDLCPSRKPLDRDLFEAIFTEFKRVELPAPIAISVSGKWMLKHQDDLEWLKGLVSKKELDITWINHSYNHEVNHLPLKQNFLLSAGTDLNIEVLENEKLMLKNGIIPSVFFRFPGLISDASLVEKIEGYGLIPIGSDAWLAKGALAKAGSIVLIHGNGNEEIGVKDFIELLKRNELKVENHSWLLLDLSNSLESQ
ncbi:hypothetical protein ACVWYG_002956 [Pedobacter sp. UYEF25]